MLVVVDFKRLQELEVQGEATLHPDTVVTAQVWPIGLRVLHARNVARWLRIQLAAAVNLAGVPIRLEGIAWTTGTKVTSHIVVAKLLASGLCHLLWRVALGRTFIEVWKVPEGRVVFLEWC